MGFSPSCHLCGEDALELVGAYSTFRRVTSDCRAWPQGGELGICQACGAVQKPVTDAWREECRRIYGSYVVYRQGNQAEQSAFIGESGLGEARSLVLMRWVFARLGSPAAGRGLDFGCGTGSLLRSMSKLGPGWKLEGQDIGDRYRSDILGIPGVCAFHQGPIAELPDGFDLITAVHVVEHLEAPATHLKTLASKLAPGGTLAIEVPNLLRNAFDLMIVDHATHFTPRLLAAVLAEAGLAATAASDDLIPKELSTLAQVASASEPPGRDDPREALDQVRNHLSWLGQLRAQAREAADAGPVAIFGTSIAGTWLDAELDSRPLLFIDEDPQRSGSSYLGRPVVRPGDAPKDVRVVIPLTPEVAPAVAERLTRVGLTPVVA